MRLLENLRKRHDGQQRADQERQLARMAVDRDKLIENNADYTRMKGTYSKENYHLFSSHFLLYQYKALWESLGEKKWWLANSITEYIMQYCLLAARNNTLICDGCSDHHPFLVSELKSLPHLDLVTLDRLWCQHSNGKYGFSVQYRIFYEENRNFDKFCRRIWLDPSQEPPGFYPNWMYYCNDILLEDKLPANIQGTKTERTNIKPEESYEYERDQDWYEDRYAGMRSETKKFAGYKDGWQYDQVQKDWYRTVDTMIYSHGDNIDPYHGFFALFSLLEKYGMTDPEKSLYTVN